MHDVPWWLEFSCLRVGWLERRLYGYNKITGVYVSDLKSQSDEDVVFAFGRRGAHVAPGDSGGPCFHEDEEGRRWLIGIISRGTQGGKDSLFTSVYPHLDWLKKLRRLADGEKL